jgi:Peroxiredoxin
MNSPPAEFSLPNVATGPDPFSIGDLPAKIDFVVLFFQRDHYCTNCRKQVQTIADRIDEFHDRGAEAVSIVPEPIEKVEGWQNKYDLPYPLLADPDAEIGEAYEQPVRFGVLGRFSDFFGRMPEVVILDRRAETAKIPYVHKGSSTFDRPSIDDLLDELDDVRSDFS